MSPFFKVQTMKKWGHRATSPRNFSFGQNHFDLVRITFGTCGSRKGLPYWAGLSIRSTTDISPQLRRLLLPSRSMKFTSFLLFLPLTSGLKE